MNKKETIFPMMPDEVDAVYTLGTLTPEFQTGTSAPQMYSKEALLRAINDRDHIMIVALDGEQLIGFCMTAIDTALRDAEIHTLVVKPEYQGKGIGTWLLEETLWRLGFRSNDVNRVVSFVQETNVEMQEFMRRHGFQKGTKFYPMELMLPRGTE